MLRLQNAMLAKCYACHLERATGYSSMDSRCVLRRKPASKTEK
jgi:hypothetical protein